MALPDRIGIFGGGRMGAGIAHAFLVRGADVRLVESSPAVAVQARERIEGMVAKSAQRGDLELPVDSVLSRLEASSDYELLSDTALIIEAVPEREELKAEVLAIAEKTAPEAWLATNTSSLSIDRLAAYLARPERLIGLHFFNPVPASDLVEIVRGPRTDLEVVQLAQIWVAALGKTAITVTDSPGFASSRLGVAIALEAMRMLEEGVASAEDIDTAMRLGYRHPVGPLRTTDLVGLDVRLAIAEYLATEVSPRFEPPEILREMVAAGRLGMKTGQGFFDWSDRA